MVKIFNYDDRNKLTANSYVIGKINGPCVIVDAGSDQDELIDYVDNHHDKVVAILLTHAHFDHIRGLSKILRHYKNKYNIPVYLDREDVELLSDPKKNTSTMVGESINLNIDTIDVEEDKPLPIKGFNIKAIKTPFHTKGSVCYLSEDDNALFTGDSLFQGSIGRTDMITSCPEKMKESLNKMKSLDDMLVVYPGHGPITRLEIEKRYNCFLR